jgi:hypothetical protein
MDAAAIYQQPEFPNAKAMSGSDFIIIPSVSNKVVGNALLFITFNNSIHFLKTIAFNKQAVYHLPIQTIA